MSRLDIWPLALGFAASVLVAVALSIAMRWVAPRVGMLDRPAGRKDHARPTPLLGGVAVYIGAILAYGLVAGVDRHTAWIVAGGAVVLVLGLWDDRVGLRARCRLAVQLVGASGVVAAGLGLTWFRWAPANSLLTVLWLVGVMNAMNCLDCADGVAAGVAAIAAGAYGLIAIAYGHFAVAAMAVAVLGACLGFLCFNFSPASIFLGDAGSTVLGLLVGTIAIAGSRGATPWHQAWVVVLPLLVPIWDIILVHLRRYRGGLRHWRDLLESSGRDHLPHRLRDLGLSARVVALSVYLMVLLLAVPGALIAHYQLNALLVAAEVGLLFLLVGERPFGELAVLLETVLRRRHSAAPASEVEGAIRPSSAAVSSR